MQHENRTGGGSPSTPLVSIIIVVFRSSAELQALLETVFPHKGENVEIILVDGGSQDGTVEYLQACGDRIDFWISEPDKGLYDAMNKAIAKARGIFLLHLNAGDRLLQIPESELRVAAHDGIEVAAFRVQAGAGTVFKPSTGIRLRFTNTLHHQGTFFRRTVYPAYNSRYRIFADFDVNQRLAKVGARMRTHRAIVAIHANDGVSNQNDRRSEAEFLEVVRTNQGVWALPFAYLLRRWHGLRLMLRF